MLDPIHHTPAYEHVVDQLRRVIYLGRYLPGDKLPSERELSQQLGVSRTTVREAVRLLEGENLIEVKRGASGGIVISSPKSKSGMKRLINSREQEQALRDIFDYRYAIECMAARLAAERRDEDDVRLLTELVESMDEQVAPENAQRFSVAEYNANDTRFHLGVAEASRNVHFVKAVEEIRAAMFLPVGAIFDQLSEMANDHHRAIADAIRAGDAPAAEQAMRDHITSSFKGLSGFFDK